MRSLILSQCRDLKMDVIIREDLGALSTVYVQDSSESAGCGLFETQEDA